MPCGNILSAEKSERSAGAPGRFPQARFSTALFLQLQRFDAHAAIHGLAHVVDGQQGNAGGRQGFHFHAGAAYGFRRGCAGYCVATAFNLELDVHPGQRQRVAERDQRRGVFGGLDAGNPGNAEHIAFFCAAGHDLA